MLNKHEVFTTEESNRLLLPSGRITVNRDDWSVRVHDGEVVGGFEIPTVRAYEPPLGPGSSELIAGTMEHGFFGEVTSDELLTYDTLVDMIGLSAGISRFNEESLWLKFALDNQVLFLAKKPCLTNLSWDQINARNVIYEGVTQVTVGQHTFDITLLRGANSDPTVQGADGLWLGYDIDASHGSEWNRLMYPIFNGIHTDDRNPVNHSDPTVDPFGSWASYSETDLMLDYRNGSGGRTWCQEVSGDNSSRRVYRGHNGVSAMVNLASSNTQNHCGWRPCLRLNG